MNEFILQTIYNTQKKYIYLAMFDDNDATLTLLALQWVHNLLYNKTDVLT